MNEFMVKYFNLLFFKFWTGIIENLNINNDEHLLAKKVKQFLCKVVTIMSL